MLYSAHYQDYKDWKILLKKWISTSLSASLNGETVGRQRDGAILCATQDGVVAEGVAHGEKADHAVDGT